MSDFLAEMATSSAERAAAAGRFSARDFDSPVVSLRLQGFDIIAEIKDQSPAEGSLASKAGSRADRARQYVAGGAAAISVLTEPSRFAGTLAHLREVVTAVPGTAVMRKDFLVEPVQIEEARAAGASGVLLIATMLADRKLRAMLDCASEHSLFVLLETFSGEDCARLRKLLSATDFDRAATGQLLFGVNTRNLRTLEVDTSRLKQLVAELPVGPRVAESGIKAATDTSRVAAMGYSLALVGTALMRSDDPAALLAEMRTAGSGSLAA